MNKSKQGQFGQSSGFGSSHDDEITSLSIENENLK